jgi:hypothetical protein
MWSLGTRDDMDAQLYPVGEEQGLLDAGPRFDDMHIVVQATLVIFSLLAVVYAFPSTPFHLGVGDPALGVPRVEHS